MAIVQPGKMNCTAQSLPPKKIRVKHDLWLEPTCFFTQHLSQSTTEITDSWRLGRVKVAADEKQVW